MCGIPSAGARKSIGTEQSRDDQVRIAQKSCDWSHLRYLFAMFSDGRTPLMSGNWKLNPITLSEATQLASDLAKLTEITSGVDVAVFPPFPYIAPVAETLRGSKVKVQLFTLVESVISANR